MTTQLKRAYLVRRNPSLTAAEFPLRWKRHSELGGPFPDLLRRHTRLLYCLADHEAGAAIGASRVYDGVGLLFVADPAMLNTPPDDPNVIPTMRADELKVFHQNVFNSAIVGAEHVIRDGADGKVAILVFTRRNASRESLQAALAGSAIAGTQAYAEHVRKHIQDEVVGEPTIEFDAMTELWFDSKEDAIATWNDPDFRQAWQAGEQAAADPAATMVFLTEVCHERRM